MINKFSKYKFWEDENPIISDLYALDILKKLSEEKIDKISFNKNSELSGRVNSAINEKKILDIFNELKEDLLMYKIKLEKNEGKASIQDFKLLFRGREILTNIKITNGVSSDNAISWKTLSYILTGSFIFSKKEFLKIENSKNKISNINYYFFVINKKSKKVIINSLKTINKITANPSNPPFQIKWSKINEVPNLENIDSTTRYIINVARESLSKNIKNEINMLNKLGKLINEKEIICKQ